MPSIIDDFASIRARADQLSGKAYEPGYKPPQPHQSSDPHWSRDPQWATGGVVSGRLPANPNLNANFGATKRPANEVIGDFAKTMYGLIGQYGAFPNTRRPPFDAADTKVQRCYVRVASDLFYAGMLAEKP